MVETVDPRRGKGALRYRPFLACGNGTRPVYLICEKWRDGDIVWLAVDIETDAEMKEHLKRSPEVEMVFVPKVREHFQDPDKLIPLSRGYCYTLEGEEIKRGSFSLT